MIYRVFWVLFCSVSVLFLSVDAYAVGSEHTAPTHHIIAEKSQVRFTVDVNNAPVSGTFSDVTGVIQFDPESLDHAHIHMVVTLNNATVSADYDEIASGIHGSDWLDTATYHQAVLDIAEIQNADKPDHYVGTGILKIHGVEQAVTVPFQLSHNEEKGNHAHQAEASFEIDRTAFGVGKGAWADASTVGHKVKLDATIHALIIQ